VPPEGFEPSHLAPEASALSPELWGLALRCHAANLPWMRLPVPARALDALGQHRPRRHSRPAPPHFGPAPPSGERPCLVLYAGNLRPSLGASPAARVRTAPRDAVPSRS
jgi:hypothetical protein